MAQKRGGGKARKITQEVKADIVEGMASGRTLLDMCEKHKVNRANVWRARQVDHDFDNNFERAACNGILAYLDIAKKDLANATSRDDVLKYKELLRHAEWMAEKRLAMFQPTQRAEVTHQGPMVVGWQTIEGESIILNDDQGNGRARLLTETAALIPAN